MESINMSMMEFIFDPNHAIFFYPIIVMLAIATLEIGLFIIGLPLSGFLDDLIPDFDLDIDAPEIDIDTPTVDVDVDTPQIPFYFGFLSWLNIGQVPILVLLILLLTSFGLMGYINQYLVIRFTDNIIPVSLVAIVSLVYSLYIVHVAGGFVAKIMPQEETTSVSTESLIGREAVITIGTATKNRVAEARVKDEHGNDHYVSVMPAGDESFTKKDRLLISMKIKNKFIVNKM